MTRLSSEIKRITNEVADVGFKWLNGVTIEEFLKQLIDEAEKSMKLVVNKCYGGFSLSRRAARALDLGYTYDNIDRADPRLVHLVERYGFEAVSGEHAHLRVVELPVGISDWEINEYDGYETVTYVLNGKIYHI